MKPKAINAFILNISILVISVIVLSIILEVAIRLFIPGCFWRQHEATDDWRLDGRLGWVYKPHLYAKFRSPSGEITAFQTNEDGMMPGTATRSKKEGTIRIILFGDSTTAGRGVSQDKTVNGELESILGKKGIRAEVLNAAVEGYATDQVLIRMKQIIPLYRPDIVSYCSCINDFNSIKRNRDFRIPKPMFTLDADGILTEIPPDLKGAKIQKVGVPRGPRGWLQYSALYRMVRPAVLILRARFSKQDPNNVLIGSGIDFFYNPGSYNKIDRKLFTALVKEMRDYAESEGARFFLYNHPSLLEVWDPCIKRTEIFFELKAKDYDRYALERYLKNIADENSMPFCPLIDYFLKNKKRGPFHFPPYDGHCNAEGYRVTAEAISQFLIDKGLVRQH